MSSNSPTITLEARWTPGAGERAMDAFLSRPREKEMAPAFSLRERFSLYRLERLAPQVGIHNPAR